MYGAWREVSFRLDETSNKKTKKPFCMLCQEMMEEEVKAQKKKAVVKLKYLCA